MPPLRPLPMRHLSRTSISSTSSTLPSSSASATPLIRGISSTTTTSPTAFLSTQPLLTNAVFSASRDAPTHSAAFSTSSIQHSSSGNGHESQFDPPGGWLFGVPPGEKPKKEGWEALWIWGFWGSLGLAAVAYAFKPDTSIQTWALEEARRRLEAEGILPDPFPETAVAKPKASSED